MDKWLDQAENTNLELDVDLENQCITNLTINEKVHFDFPAYHKEKLMNGWDDISLTLKHEDKIEAYEEAM